LGADQLIAIIGDVGGWYTRLAEAVRLLGGNAVEGYLPEDLVIIQMGDLVHKGPDSEKCMALVGQMHQNAPGQWVQLVGNHEASYLAGGVRGRWSEELPDRLIGTLRSWKEAGLLHLAVAIDAGEDGQILVTHSGLTRYRWEQLEQPVGAREAAIAIERQWDQNPVAALRPGGSSVPSDPGVVGADAASELLTSWAEAKHLPFNQIHGHTSAFLWETGSWHPALPQALQERAVADPTTRHTTVRWPGGWIMGIDPRYTQEVADIPLAPLVLRGQLLEMTDPRGHREKQEKRRTDHADIAQQL
jgi:hypothetical protein